MSKSYRKFNGKLYQLAATGWSKKKAQNIAKKMRKQGVSARIIKAPKSEAFSTTGEAWRVYIRRPGRS